MPSFSALLAIASSKPLFLVNALILISLGYCLKQALILVMPSSLGMPKVIMPPEDEDALHPSW
jgi:hypothetical protein